MERERKIKKRTKKELQTKSKIFMYNLNFKTMKKSLFIAAAAAMALSSCSKNEITPDMSEGNAIGFGVYTGQATKGTVVDSETLGASADAGGKGFGVLAYYHSSDDANVAVWADTDKPNFMYNQQVKGDGTGAAAALNWTYSPIKYWPNDTKDRISFFAYAPWEEQSGSQAAVLSANTKEGIPTITYTIADLPGNMIDFTVAKPLYEKAKPDNSSSFTSNDSKINLNFTHVLTRLNFFAWTSNEGDGGHDDKTKVVVTDLQIVGTGNSKLKDKNNATSKQSKGFYVANKFTFANKTDAEGTGTDLTPIGAWAAIDDATKHTENYPLSAIMNKARVAHSGYENDGIDITGTATGTATALLKDKEFVFLLPPNGNDGITDGGATDDVLVYIQYDVVTTDAKVDGGHTVVTQQDILALPATTLQAKTAYNIYFQLQLDKVDLAATVAEDWDSPETVEINTPDTNP